MQKSVQEKVKESEIQNYRVAGHEILQVDNRLNHRGQQAANHNRNEKLLKVLDSLLIKFKLNSRVSDSQRKVIEDFVCFVRICKPFHLYF
jgi:hypothetical protein